MSLSGWQVQAMWEADAAAEWERLNAPDPAEKYLKEAAGDMGKAIDLMDKAENFMVDAISDLDGLPMADKVSSMLDALMDLRIDIRVLKEKYERGERE